MTLGSHFDISSTSLPIIARGQGHLPILAMLISSIVTITIWLLGLVFFLSLARMQKHAAALVKEYAVKTPGLDTPLKNLSGGNIQKLIMARELSRRPSVLIAAQPTRGVDISATGYIHERLLAQRESGIGILLISEDLDEIRALSDRIAVMYEGRITGVLARGQGSVEQIGLMMAGISMEEALRS